MVVVSYSGKEINAKLVYYGAGLSGKTTNLEAIYEAVPDASRGKMVSMKTQSDRTLFFDLLPLDLGEIMGFKTRFLLYTVPGQVFYNATRKLVLKGADAIVFVADSEVGKMEENKESLANLRANLAEYGLSLDSIPWVIQYNKRDLPNVYTVDELNAELNPTGVPSFEAVASEGRGVFETFRGVSHLLMEKVTKDLRRPSATTPRPVSMTVEPVADTNVAPTRMAPPPAPVQAIRHEVQATPEPVTPEPVFEVETPAAPRIPATLHVEPTVNEPIQTPVTTSAASDDAFRAMPLPRATTSLPRPTLVPPFEATPAQESLEIVNETAARPSTVLPRPTLVPLRDTTPTTPEPSVTAFATVTPIASPTPVAAHDVEVRNIVVPVSLPPGGRYEIVIRLQIDTQAAA